MSEDHTDNVHPPVKIRRQLPTLNHDKTLGNPDRILGRSDRILGRPDRILGRPDIKPSAKVCRKLLPVNHAEVAATLDNEYRKHMTEKSRQWNYDFEKDEPIRTENGGFSWVQCGEGNGKENGEGSGTSWVGMIQHNNEDDDVFHNMAVGVSESHGPRPRVSEGHGARPRGRLYGISEDPDDFEHSNSYL